MFPVLWEETFFNIGTGESKEKNNNKFETNKRLKQIS